MTAATFEASLFEHLTTLFNGSSTVRDFRHWFNSASWDSGNELPDELYELASDIEHLGFIRDSGIWDDATYVQNLQTEVDSYCEVPADSQTPSPDHAPEHGQCVKVRVA